MRQIDGGKETCGTQGGLYGKSALMLFDRHPELRPKYADRHFWARGYYVATIGNVNEETIRQYIKEQEENDKLEDGMK